MLFNAKTINGYELDSLDGTIGDVQDLYFDDHHWTIRYLIADTGNWLKERQVLISPYALRAVNGMTGQISLALTKKQIEDSPSIACDKPVSKQFEDSYYDHYGWPMYWGGPYIWGAYPSLIRDRDAWIKPEQKERGWDPNLRSVKEVTGYHILANDGEIGHVEDFIVDDETWAIRYLVIDTRNWLPGKKVLISQQWIDRVSWNDAQVILSISRESVQMAPEFSDEALITRDYEDKLHRHYDRQGYWVEDPASGAHVR